MKETELYPPVKTLLESMGFLVQSEVGKIDVMAIKEEAVIVVELKLDLNLKLIVQGALRQKMTDFVYVAIPKPTYKIRTSKNFKEKIYLLNRLGIGLIFVDFKGRVPEATIEEAPLIFDLKKAQVNNRRVKKMALKEMSLRSGDYNLGGQQGKKITAYKENVLLIVGLLSIKGPMRVKEIKALAGDKTGSILQKNFHGYFYRIARGTYDLTEEGKAARKTYGYIIDRYLEKIIEDKGE